MLPIPGHILDAMDDRDHCEDPGTVFVRRTLRGNGESMFDLSPGSIQDSVPAPI